MKPSLALSFSLPTGEGMSSISQESQEPSIDECYVCKDEGWYFYDNKKTHRAELRCCEKCGIFESDRDAAEFAMKRIRLAMELSERVTQTRQSDDEVRRATAHIFGDKVPTVMLPETLPLRLDLQVRLDLYNTSVQKQYQHPAMLIVEYVKNGLAKDKQHH